MKLQFSTLYIACIIIHKEIFPNLAGVEHLHGKHMPSAEATARISKCIAEFLSQLIMFNLFKRRKPDLDWRDLSVEPTGDNDFGPCECCGKMSRTVWGLVHSQAGPLAAYFVQWTLNSPEHGANFDLIVGEWGIGTTSKDRQAISMIYRNVNNQGSFMVIDASKLPQRDPSLVSSALSREEVIGSLLAKRAFAIVDAVFMKDTRIEEIRSWSSA